MTTPAIPDAYGLDLGDRKEVWQLLKRLPAHRRMEWLRWCCERSRGPHGSPIEALGGGAVGEVYTDWLTLCTQCRLGMAESRAELERRVREFGTPLAFQAGGLLLGKG